MSTPQTAPAMPATIPAPKFSQQMLAVLMVFSADPDLYAAVSPFLDFAGDSIDWEGIRALGLSSGHKVASDWAFILWRDETPEGSNPFDSIWSCEDHLRRAIVKGLSVRWKIAK